MDAAGAIAFQYPDQTTGDDVLRRLEAHGGWGAIVGCHGSGKSTLVASLLPLIRNRGSEPIVVSLHGGRNRLETCIPSAAELSSHSMLIIDGFEQLGRWQRWRLLRTCLRRSCGLLVTSHRSCGLPELAVLKPQIELIHRLVENSLPDHHGCIQDDDVQRAWKRHPGNVREVFFSLYDVFEHRRVHL